MACNSRAKMNDSVRKLSKFQHAPLRPWVWLFFVYRICLFLKSTSLNLQLIFLFPENSPPALPISWSLPFNIVASCSALSMHSAWLLLWSVCAFGFELAIAWLDQVTELYIGAYLLLGLFLEISLVFFLTIFLKLKLIQVILSDVPAVELSHFYCYGCAQMILSGVPAVELNHFYCYCWALSPVITDWMWNQVYSDQLNDEDKAWKTSDNDWRYVLHACHYWVFIYHL